MTNKSNSNRRIFLKKSAVVGTVVSLGGLASCVKTAEDNQEEGAQKKQLNILILGGTSFLGPHQIAYALGRGHKVSTFTRGKTMPTVHQNLFSQVNMLTGDRSNDLSALETGTWDVVIDNSGHNVEWTRASAELLKERVGMYVFTSSTGVYYPYLGDNITEDTEVLLEEPETVEDEDMKLEYWYGVMKSNSENVAREIFGEDRALAVRPTYMFGPGDKTNRFIHWPLRLAKGGEVLVPGKPQDPVQYADVRDVAEFMIRLIEEGVSGTFNAVGPSSPQTMPEFVSEAAGAFDVETTFVQVDDYEFLKEHKMPYIVPWIMPEGNNYGSARASNAKAISAGLTFRNLADSVRDTYEWWQTLPDEKRAEYEEDPEIYMARETAVLEAWKSRNS